MKAAMRVDGRRNRLRLLANIEKSNQESISRRPFGMVQRVL
jgi:hypothetical protein